MSANQDEFGVFEIGFQHGYLGFTQMYPDDYYYARGYEAGVKFLDSMAQYMPRLVMRDGVVSGVEFVCTVVGAPALKTSDQRI